MDISGVSNVIWQPKGVGARAWHSDALTPLVKPSAGIQIITHLNYHTIHFISFSSYALVQFECYIFTDAFFDMIGFGVLEELTKE